MKSKTFLIVFVCNVIYFTTINDLMRINTRRNRIDNNIKIKKVQCKYFFHCSFSNFLDP